MKRDEVFERLLEELEDIIKRFNRSVINYSDTMLKLDGTLGEAFDCGDIDKETFDYYVRRVDEMIRYMPPVVELETFLEKYCKH